MKHASDSRKHAPNTIQDLAGSIDLPELLQVLGIDERTKEQGRLWPPFWMNTETFYFQNYIKE